MLAAASVPGERDNGPPRESARGAEAVCLSSVRHTAAPKRHTDRSAATSRPAASREGCCDDECDCLADLGRRTEAVARGAAEPAAVEEAEANRRTGNGSGHHQSGAPRSEPRAADGD